MLGAVEVVEGLDEAVDEVAGLGFVVVFFLDDAVEEFSALDAFGDEVVVVLFVEEGVEGLDFGVGEAFEDVGFVVEGAYVDEAFEFGFGYAFDGDPLRSFFMLFLLVLWLWT